ncbi:MAG: hypothetical protein ACK4YF_04535 [Exilispira sp.]
MRGSLRNWFITLFSNYSRKTAHLYKIFLYKFDIYLYNRKKSKYFKQIGKTFYTELLNGKETEQILEIIQPILSNIDKIDREIQILMDKIEYISQKEKISGEDVAKIDKFIIETDKKLKDSIFDENYYDEIDDLIADNDIDINDINKENNESDKKLKKIKSKKSK